MKEQIINIEEIFELEGRRKEINSIPMDRIIFHYKGNEIKIESSAIQDWVFTGLTNIDFVNSYKKAIIEYSPIR